MIEVWDQNARARHEQVLGSKDLSFWELAVPEILRLLHGLPNLATSHVLDIGCGTGVLSHILSRHVGKVIGIDPSERSIELANEPIERDGDVTFEISGIETYGIGHQDKFDCAVAHMTLQAIEPLEPALKSVSFSLKLGGVFAFSIPHPCFFAMHRNEIADATNYSYHTPSNHTIPFIISNDRNPLPAPVPYFHRSLELYSSALYEAGFVVEQIREPFPGQELIERYEKPWVYPRFMIFVCRKR